MGAASVPLLLFILLTPTVSAAAADPPGTLIVDVVGFAQFPQGAYVARLNVTFELSPDDNQTVPGFGYTMCGFNAPFGPCTSLNSSLIPIGNRTGWAYGGTQTIVESCAVGDSCANYPPTNLTYNLTAWNGTTPSTMTCNVTIDFTSVSNYQNDPANSQAIENSGNLYSTLFFPYGGNGTGYDGRSTYHACGKNATLESPDGLNAIVMTPYGPAITDPSVTYAHWKLSPTETNTSVGNYDYYLFRSSSMPLNPALVYRGALVKPYANDSSGVRTNAWTQSGCTICPVESFDDPNVVNPLYLRVMARDNVTHQRSDFSCYVLVNQGQQYSASACGSLGLPTGIEYQFTGTISPTPVFPFMNVNSWSASVGVSAFNGGIILGLVFVAFAAGIGFIVARAIGGLTFGVVGIVGAFVFGLFPTWLLFVVFGAALAVIVLKSMKGNPA